MKKQNRNIKLLSIVLFLFVFGVMCYALDSQDLTQLRGCWLGYWDIDFYGGKCWIGLDIHVKSQNRIEIDFHRISGAEEYRKCRNVSYQNGVLRFEWPSGSIFRLKVDFATLTMEGDLETKDWIFPTFFRFDPRITDAMNDSRFFKEFRSPYKIPEQLGDGLSCASLHEVNMDIEAIEELLHLIRNERYKDIRSLLVYKDQKLVLEEYFWKKTVGGFPYLMEGNELQNIYSGTRTFTAALVGIAIEKSLIPGTSVSIAPYFPDYAEVLNTDQKNKITIENLLTMEAGFQWRIEEQEEYQPLFDQIRSTGGSQVIEYVLKRPMTFSPGRKYVYNNELSTILGEIVRRISSQTLPDFAGKNLFGPLGIHDYAWHIYPDGVTSAGNGLKMRPRDMVKFGSLFVNEGRWNGRQILPEKWIDLSFIRYTDPGNNPYGYHWWLDKFYVNGQKIFCPNARGHYGQFIFVFPALEMVCVMTSAENDRHQWDQPVEMVAKYLLPAALPSAENLNFIGQYQVSQILLDNYSGIYRHKENRYGIVARKGGSLFYKAPGCRFRKLFALSETDFISRDKDILLTFVENKTNAVTRYEVSVDGILEDAVRSDSQPEQRQHREMIVLPWFVLKFCGIIFAAAILWGFLRLTFRRFLIRKGFAWLQQKGDFFQNLAAIWTAATALVGIWIILEILNDAVIIEEILNLGLYRPGWDELLAGWVYLALSSGMIILVFFIWKKQGKPLEVKFLLSAVAASSVGLIFISLDSGLFVLF